MTGPLYEKSGFRVTVVFLIILMFSLESDSKVVASSIKTKYGDNIYEIEDS